MTTNVIPVDRLVYSDKYTDEEYEYRHVIVPKEYMRLIPKQHLMTETEWRNIGIAQSPGWEHYMIHTPEPNILMFRRKVPPKAPAPSAQAAQGTKTAVH